MIRKTDVVIVGAGPAGLACAIKCNDLGIDFLLIEALAISRTVSGISCIRPIAPALDSTPIGF